MSDKSETSELVSLRRAAEILGVHPATVRNWADEGKLASIRTPGNHRRFRKSDLLHYAQQQGELQPLEVQVILQNALGEARMRVGEGTLNAAAWYERMSDALRGQMRVLGRGALDEMRKYLGAGAPDSGLAAAITLGKEYAEVLSSEGLTLPQALRGFFYFSDFVINSILTWSEITPRSTSDWGVLLRQVNTFTNTMLLSIVEYYEAE